MTAHHLEVGAGKAICGERAVHEEPCTRGHHTTHLGETVDKVIDLNQDITAPHKVSAGVIKRQMLHDALVDGDPPGYVDRSLTQSFDCLVDMSSYRLDTNTGNRRVAAGELDQLLPVATTDIEDSVAVADVVGSHVVERVRAARVERLVESIVDIPCRR